MSAIRITGTLGRDAELRFSTDGVAVQAVRRVGGGEAGAVAARNSAAHLRKGTRVTVHAGAYDVEHLPTPHLVLRRVDMIEHQPSAPRHEPRDAIEITQPQT